MVQEEVEEVPLSEKEEVFAKLLGDRRSQPNKVSDELLAEAFDYCDGNHDGLLEVDDLSVLIHNLRMKVYPAMVKELYTKYRDPESGYINFATFKKVLGQLKPSINSLIKRSQAA